MEFNFLDGKTGHLLWIVQTLTISGVFVTLWFHNRAHLFHLLFAFGFFTSAMGSAIGYFSANTIALAAFVSVSAHGFWICAIYLAQGRHSTTWFAVPSLVMLTALLIPMVRNNEAAIFLAFHASNVIGFGLQAATLLSTPGYRSGTRKFLAIALVSYSVVLMVMHFTSVFAVSAESSQNSIINAALNGSSLLGLTLILMSAAKMVIEDMERNLTHLALTDHLTGIYNRRALDKIFQEKRREAHDAQQFIAITMFDIDHFKKINDQHGHAFGDHVLKCFVQLVLRHLGQNDDFIRMGGEEFAVISKISDLSEAAKLAEKIRIDFGNLILQQEEKRMTATVSAGIAAERIARADLYALLSMADRGLYAAKKGGRDRCVIYDEMTSVVIPSQQRDPTAELENYTDKQVAVLNRISAIAEAHRSAP